MEKIEHKQDTDQKPPHAMHMYCRTAEDIQHLSCSWITWLYLLSGVADDDGGADPPAVCTGGGAPAQPGGSAHPTGGRKEEE